MSGVSLGEKVDYLRQAGIYEDGSPHVDAIETHMSWVFLTRGFVYKLKKPIRYDRLDFSTLARRDFYCHEEVRLNRRLAPSVYLGTIALTQEADGGLAIEGAGPPVDWLVHMRRLPESRMLDWILARRVVQEAEVQPVARRLADFFVSARRVPISTVEYLKRLEEGIQEDLHELSLPEYGLDRNRVEAIASSQLAFLSDHPKLLEERVRQERIIEGHGDLRPEHICLTTDPVVIDCLDFCEELREVDPLDELAFLVLECERLGQPRVGRWFLDAYLERSADRLSPALFEFYRRYRILRRTKLAAWRIVDPSTRDHAKYARRARHYLELAGSPD